MKVIAIIVTYNGSKWIEKCLDSLINSTIKTDIIVVDNNSSDSTISIIESKYLSIKLIKSPRNLGFGKANNLGLKIANDNNANYVLLLNQDASINMDTLEKLIDIHKQYQEFGIISPVHLNGEGTALDNGFIAYASSQFGCNNFYSDLYLSNLKEIYSTKFVNAACWLISEECLKRVGGFDPLFFHYGEDENYTQRVLYHKFKIGICPNTFIFHDRPQTFLFEKDVQLMIREKLIYLADVNNTRTNNRINRQISLYLFKIILLFIQLKYSQLLENFKVVKYIIRNYKKISYSVACNKKTGLHWLT